MATSVGRVARVMKGTWSSSATYEMLDAVSYNNGLYIAKQNVPAGTLPTTSTYWQVALDLSNIYPTDQALTIPASGTLTFGLSSADVILETGKTYFASHSSGAGRFAFYFQTATNVAAKGDVIAATRSLSVSLSSGKITITNSNVSSLGMQLTTFRR